jgi:molybdenum cofactor guanylyltransferase
VRIAGVVLAGGQSRRMGGGDKCLRLLLGRPILTHIIERTRDQVTTLALNANGDLTRFAAFALPVIADSVPDFAGPLAGVLAGLDWAEICGASHVASFSGDAPFLPFDLVARLAAAVEDGRHDLACAASGGSVHPVIGLWPVSLRHQLRRALVEEGIRKVDAWTARWRLATVDFAAAPIDPFFNVNRPEELAQADRMAATLGALERAAAPPQSR